MAEVPRTAGPRTGPAGGSGQSATNRGHVLGQACQNRRTALHEAVNALRGPHGSAVLAGPAVIDLAEQFYAWLQIPLRGGAE